MKKKKKGFTLIELIVVIAIIGILAVIAVPKFGNVQQNSKIKADISTAKNIADTATMLLTQDKEGVHVASTKYKVEKAAASTAESAKTIGNKVAEQLQNVPSLSTYKGSFYVEVDANDDVTVYAHSDESASVTIGSTSVASDSDIKIYPTQVAPFN